MTTRPRVRRGLQVLGVLGVLACYGYLLAGCASLDVPGTPRARFVAAAAAFEGAANVAYAYGSGAASTSAQRELLASIGDASVVVITQTRTSLAAGTITDEQLDLAASFLEAATAQLQDVGGR